MTQQEVVEMRAELESLKATLTAYEAILAAAMRAFLEDTSPLVAIALSLVGATDDALATMFLQSITDGLEERNKR